MLKYTATAITGHKFVFRFVESFVFDATAEHLVVKIPGREFTVNGCVSFVGEPIDSLGAAAMEVFPPDPRDKPDAVIPHYEFRREPAVPRELSTRQLDAISRMGPSSQYAAFESGNVVMR